VSRMASHFQSMVSEARTAAKAAIDKAEAKAKEEAFLASLPMHWRFVRPCKTDTSLPCPPGGAIDVWIGGDVLYEVAKGDDALGETSIKRKVNCVVKRGGERNESVGWGLHL
jgi:hypothetical protein